MLSTATVRANVAVSDLDRAATFYEDVLGLKAREDVPSAMRIYRLGGDAMLQVHPSEAFTGPSGATVASFGVGDRLDEVVDGLSAAGVTFERYEDMNPDERGIHSFGDHRSAWFTDPDGNILAVDND